MSVQAGIWNFDGKAVDHNLIADFNTSLKRQGPDGESCWVDGSIVLIYRPFHTTAESRREQQPFVSRRGFVLTWDGRLDNRDELVLEFRSYLESDPTDVGLVAAAFDRWETDCFRRIVGDWAVSIWEPDQHELLFAVDYMAIRHIFYYLKNDRIWWSTDLSPLILLSGDRFHIDDDYIAGYFANEPDAHLTPYREIREVPPGQFVRIWNARGVTEHYWRCGPTSNIRYKTDADYEEHFRYVFRQSVQRRLRSDSPILAELSGGLDSSSIVCMADDILADGVAQTPRIDTLSYFDKTEPNGDDWIYFPKVEEKRGRAGFHIDASKRATSNVTMESQGFLALPGYIGTDRQLEVESAQVLLCGGYRAVLSGLGGDEFLGGIPNPSAQLSDLIVQFRFVSLARQLTAWSLVKRLPWIHLLGRALSELMPPPLVQYFVRQARAESWIDARFAKRHRSAVRLLGTNTYPRFMLPTRRSFIRGMTIMARRLAKWLPAIDSPQETRYPYLDQNLIEFVMSIPATQLLRPGERRSLMRRSLVNIVPQVILSRRTKQLGSRTPIVTLERHMEDLEAMFDCPLSSRFGYIAKAPFLQELQAIRSGREIHILPVLRALSLELWLRDLASRLLIEASPLKQPHVATSRSEASA